MLKNVALAKKQFYSSTDCAHAHVAYVVRKCLNMSFPGRWIRRGWPKAWPSRSPDLTSLNLFLFGYVEDQSRSQRLNTLDKLKAQITTAITNDTTGMLQRVWQEVDRIWDVRRATEGAICKAFRI
jgi:hypothetical protein